VQDTAADIPAARLLANDTNPNGTLAIIAVANGLHGSVSFDPLTGTVTFTPEPGFHSSNSGVLATFTYTAADGCFSRTATVMVTVHGSQTSNLLPPQLNGDDVIVTFAGISRRSYVIQSAPSANGPWTDRATNAIGAGSNTSQFLDPEAKSQSRFYRTRCTP
jgi:hypothetical protein